MDNTTFENLTNETNKGLIDYELIPYCMNKSNNDEAIDNIVYWVEGVSLTTVGVIGTLGNIMTCLVLKKLGKLQSNVFNQLIVILCIFDTLFAAFSMLEYSFKKGFKLLTYTSPIYVNIWPQIIYPLHNISYSVSLFLTLAIAIERYMAVCHPFVVGQERGLNHAPSGRHTNGSNSVSRGRHNNSNAHTDAPKLKKRTFFYLIPSLVLSILVNIPKFLEFKTVSNENKTIIEPTELRLNTDYELYYINWLRTLTNAFLPFVMLSFLNGRIIYQIKAATKISSNRPITQNKREANLTRILILMVFCFLFCNMGKFILNLYDLAVGFDRVKACTRAGLFINSPMWVVAMMSMNHLLLTMNASANLFLFTSIGTQFRTTLLAMLHLGKRTSNQKASPMSHYSRNEGPRAETYS